MTRSAFFGGTSAGSSWRDRVAETGDRRVADSAHHFGDRGVVAALQRQQKEQPQEVGMPRLLVRQFGQLRSTSASAGIAAKNRWAPRSMTAASTPSFEPKCQ